MWRVQKPLSRLLPKFNFVRSYGIKKEQVLPSLNVFLNAAQPSRLDRVAIISHSPTHNYKFTYRNLLDDSEAISERIQKLSGNKKDISESRVALLCASGYDYARSQWAIWRSGGIFVPLCTSHPPAELEYVLTDSGCSSAICDPAHEPVLRPLAEKLNIPLIVLDNLATIKRTESSEPSQVTTFPMDPSRGAMIIYTSGTTGKPKGVVTTHRGIESQILSMIGPWEWTERDHILHVLPLHHVHGVVNVLACPLYAGATCEMMEKFDAKTVWSRFIKRQGLNLFMAVPTIYAKLIQEYDKFSPEQQKEATAACKDLRLMVSGSAPLPESILKKWKEISGHVLLERYGMTEIGMALSNPLHGERKPGFVGFPLPGVTARIVDEAANKVVTQEGVAGELRIKGDSVFKEYWNKPQATLDTFDSEGWFKTGDIATVMKGYYKILGRASVDIIKSGGYKISALDIERELLEHPDIEECAVVGLPDLEFGQKIAAVVVLKKNKNMTLERLREWGKARMASYKVPRLLFLFDAIPKNAMGKINKKELAQIVTSPPPA